MPSDKNLIIVVLDSLRAKNLPMYGYTQNTSPFLTELADKGGYIENYLSNSPWTLPSHVSMFTGKLPSEHSATAKNTYFEGENLLVESMKQKGLTTACFTENGLISPDLGIDSFDFHYDCKGRGGKVWKSNWTSIDNFSSKWLTFFKRIVYQRDVESLKSFFKEVLDAKAGVKIGGEKYNPEYSKKTVSEFNSFTELIDEDQNYFAFFNLCATHFNYTFNKSERNKFLKGVEEEEVLMASSLPSVDLKERDCSDRKLELLEKSYNASISYADTLIEQIADISSDDTEIIVLGDHGETLGEKEVQGYKMLEHMYGTFEQTLKVPLITSSNIKLENNMADHRDLIAISEALIEGKKTIKGRNVSFAEYYGKEALHTQLGKEIPENLRHIYSRKSFSIINSQWKMDITTDGRYIWELGENESTELNMPDVSEELLAQIPFVLTTVLQDIDLL